MKTIVCTAIIVLFLAGALAEADPHYRTRNIAPELRDNRYYRHRDVVRIESVAQINPAYVSSYSPDGYDSATQADILAQIRTLSARLDQLTALAASKATGGTAVVQPSTPGKAATPANPGAPSVIVVPPGGGSAPITVVPPAKGNIPGGAALGLAVLNGHCAACHQAGKLAENQKFTLLDTKGNLVSLTTTQKLNVIQKTLHAEMPPPVNSVGATPVSDAEFGGIADLLR